MVDKEVKANVNPLEQFILLAKGTRGAAIISLVNQVLETRDIYVFGELLQLPNIQELEKNDGAPYWRLLNIFAYGRYSDYKANRNSLPELSSAQTVKLRHLTIVSLASESKYIPYSVLLQELEISNVRELEDLIIEAIYADVIHGKLDQQNSQLEVEYAIGRDIKAENVNSIVSVLGEWCSSCETVLHGIEKQIQRSNNYRDIKATQKTKFDSELENLKAAIKATGSQDLEENTRYDSAQGNPFLNYSQKTQRNQTSTRGIKGKFFASRR
ncbi:COP9 signalosome complex subunit 7b isoform X1 [Paramuricea clavata]|uniref:COP9 signalosome complex subunit 7b isoform X1 n=1 Tax=Paramuricea clavata TaxID=317549 RepID=A0A7D9DTZ2_PARCT|nr:COP9 signalosome complex subunit 7b isoform X1 [Paramuricea clavata]